MARHFDKDPTEFFSVVGAPYVRESHGPGCLVSEQRTGDHRPRKLEIGFAGAFAAFCVASFGFSLFATSGAAKLVEVAYQAVK
jgi:hypothetical protein